MGRVDDGIAIAKRDGVILTCFGDMMRVPGGDGSFLDPNAVARCLVGHPIGCDDGRVRDGGRDRRPVRR